MHELTHAEFRDLTFLPCRPDRSSRTGASFGVYAANGQAVRAFDHPWCPLRPPEAAQLNLPGPIIYGGLLMDHFGHFLVEAMSRLWFIKAHPDLPILWHSIELPVPHRPWTGWRDEVWRLLGLGARRHHVIRTPAAFGRILLPQSGLVTDHELHPLQVRAMACVETIAEVASPRVWLSRCGLPEQFGRIEREDELEAMLAARGWQIIRPQTMSVAAQAAVFATTDVAAGFAGSAFHAALLTAAPKARLLILDRPSVHRNYYQAVANARGLEYQFLTAPLDALGALNAWTTFRLRAPEAVAQTVIEAASGA